MACYRPVNRFPAEFGLIDVFSQQDFGLIPMTIDKSLKRKGRLSRSRNVLKRHERIEQMQKEDKWVDGQSPIGLAKTRVVKTVIGKKKKKKTEEEGAAAPAGGKAAPAKGGKK